MVRQGKYTKKVSLLTRTKRATRRKWRWFKSLSKPKKVMLISAPILAFLVLTPLLTYAYYFNDIADQEHLMNRNNTGIVLTDKNGETIYSTGRAEHRKLIPIEDISPNLKNALVASEDKDFYQHSGFSVTGILRAFYDNIISRQITGGGSTITQQLAKNTLLSENQTFFRKYQELAVSIAIEQRYSKDQILDMYLNSVFFGGTTFGIEDASQNYFNKSPKDLTLAESAMLVGILPAPNVYSPTLGNPTYAKERQTTVLTRMVTNKYITEQQKQEALAVVLTYAPTKEVNDSEAPHFAEMVLNQLYSQYGEENVLRSGYQVRTTLDLGLQRKLTANINSHISYIQRNGGSNASGVAIDPTSGEVRALVGSADWKNPDWGKVNMVTTARQPGSSFKPVYYSDALAQGIITPATILADVATDFDGYKPQNASRTYSGNVSVRNALSRSLNIPSVKVMQKEGIENAVKAAQRMGITAIDSNKTYGLSLALGAAEAPLLQMTNAYAAFANQGQQYSTTMIQQVNNKYDNTIFKTAEKSKQVLSPEGAFLISSILSDNNARAPIFGSSLTVPGRTAAVKTGTTDEERDAWTIGYTPQLAVGVWVGNNDNTTMLNGGSGMAGPIWVNTMRQALDGTPNTPFTQPSGVIQKPICYSNGGLASGSGTGTYTEFFLASALPTTTCSPTPEKKVEDKPKETPTPVDTTPKDSTSSGSGDGTTTPSSDGTTTPSSGDSTPTTPVVPPIIKP
ncbi:MAG: penicillin-binding protein family, nonfunctional [Candidatus Saccharibacteria bacterium]|nr:penicillin-binding protein family, nonfunctional [Candidatus Saccharibacteria bacterium]